MIQKKSALTQAFWSFSRKDFMDTTLKAVVAYSIYIYIYGSIDCLGDIPIGNGRLYCVYSIPFPSSNCVILSKTQFQFWRWNTGTTPQVRRYLMAMGRRARREVWLHQELIASFCTMYPVTGNIPSAGHSRCCQYTRCSCPSSSGARPAWMT